MLARTLELPCVVVIQKARFAGAEAGNCGLQAVSTGYVFLCFLVKGAARILNLTI